MTIVKPTALAILKDCVVSIKVGTGTANDFAPVVSNVTITPTTSAQTFTGMGVDSTYTDQTAPTWAAALTYAQDWDDPNSLANFLYDNMGKDATVDFRPRDKSAGWSIKTTLAPGAIGGAVGTFATATVNLGVKEKPARLAKVAA